MNLLSTDEDHLLVPDKFGRFRNYAGMAPKTPTTWYIQEWMKAHHKVQADLVKDLEWPKGKANKVWHGQQRYNEDLVNEIASWLNVRPYELLMSPEDAMRLRAIRGFAAEIVKSEPVDEVAPAEIPRRSA